VILFIKSSTKFIHSTYRGKSSGKAYSIELTSLLDSFSDRSMLYNLKAKFSLTFRSPRKTFSNRFRKRIFVTSQCLLPCNTSKNLRAKCGQSIPNTALNPYTIEPSDIIH